MLTGASPGTVDIFGGCVLTDEGRVEALGGLFGSVRHGGDGLPGTPGPALWVTGRIDGSTGAGCGPPSACGGPALTHGP